MITSAVILDPYSMPLNISLKSFMIAEDFNKATQFFRESVLLVTVKNLEKSGLMNPSDEIYQMINPC